MVGFTSTPPSLPLAKARGRAAVQLDFFSILLEGLLIVRVRVGKAKQNEGVV
jgi:hypothetical protein